MPSYKHMIARFPFLAIDHPDVTDWLVDTVLRMKQDPRIGGIHNWRKNDTPVTMLRNRCARNAQQLGVDYLWLVDNDMSPDMYLPSNPQREYADPNAKPFFNTAWDFALQKRDEGEIIVIAAPYCGPPPHENPYIFQWADFEGGAPTRDFKLTTYSREEAAKLSGIHPAAALPTGLMLIDMRAFNLIKPPWFYYEWKDDYEDEKASTEDVTFSRDLALAGVKLYAAWDCWAGHHKTKRVGRPRMLYTEQISEKFETAKERGMRMNERIIYVEPETNGHRQPEGAKK